MSTVRNFIFDNQIEYFPNIPIALSFDIIIYKTFNDLQNCKFRDPNVGKYKK